MPHRCYIFTDCLSAQSKPYRCCTFTYFDSLYLHMQRLHLHRFWQCPPAQSRPHSGYTFTYFDSVCLHKADHTEATSSQTLTVSACLHKACHIEATPANSKSLFTLALPHRSYTFTDFHSIAIYPHIGLPHQSYAFTVSIYIRPAKESRHHHRLSQCPSVLGMPNWG